MIRFSDKGPWIRIVGIIILLCLIYYGVKTADMVIDRFMIQRGLMEEGATKITKKHFRQPEKSVFNVKDFTVFLDNVTKHKDGILASKALYAVILFAYFVLASLIIVIVATDKRNSENRT